MSHHGKYGDLDYARWAKGGFLVGLALVLAGGGGELFLAATGTDVAGWVHTILVDVELLGILTAVAAPVTFGVVLPLTE